jgi:undecaprenyl-diphosphatase
MTIVIVGSLVLLAVLLWIAEKVALRARGLNAVTWRDALIVGCAQALALIPGASRSGTTITAGLFLGLDRPAAARFSFLLSIPAVLASGLFELLRIRSTVFELGAGNLFIATVVSGFAGYAAIAWLLRFLMRNSLMSFVWYRIGLGFLISFALFHGWITP